MSDLRIKINIANRVYPLTIPREDEEGIRRAAKKIEELLKSFEANYAVRDKQDLLAMAVLKFASDLEQINQKNVIVDSEIEDRLQRIESLLAEK